MAKHDYCVYIMASESGTLYIGITNDLARRVHEHKESLALGFSKRYQCWKCIYFEEYEDVRLAIAREKQLKHWSRKKNQDLIRDFNPSWKDIVIE